MNDVMKVAAEYEKNYGIVGRAHYLASDRCAIRNRWLGIPVIVITTVVGTTIFGTLNEDPDPRLRIAAGLISLLGAVLSALQTTLGLGHVADRHKAAAARYRSIKRRLRLFCLKYTASTSEHRQAAIAELEALNEDLESIAAESPNIPDGLYDKAVKECGAENNEPDPAL